MNDSTLSDDTAPDLDVAPQEQVIAPAPTGGRLRRHLPWAVSGVLLASTIALGVSTAVVASERDGLADDVRSLQATVKSVRADLTSMTEERDEAIEERDNCSARAFFYREGALSFSDEVKKFAISRFYAMDSTEAVAYIQAANSFPCPGL